MDTFYWPIFCLFVGMISGNLVEWVAHKYFLHAWGMRKGSPFSFHWHSHHRSSRKNGFFDKDYSDSFFTWNSRVKEVLGLTLLVVVFSPVFFVFPWVYAGMVLWTIVYYLVHHYAHTHPKWAKKYLRWHYDHHMGTNQHANYNVVVPLWDYILGTRVKYKYSEDGRPTPRR